MVGHFGRYGFSNNEVIMSTAAPSAVPGYVSSSALAAAQQFANFETYLAYSVVVDPSITHAMFDQAKASLGGRFPRLRGGPRFTAPRRRPAVLDQLPPSQAPGMVSLAETPAEETAMAMPVVEEGGTDWKTIALVGVVGLLAGKVLLKGKKK